MCNQAAFFIRPCPSSYPELKREQICNLPDWKTGLNWAKKKFFIRLQSIKRGIHKLRQDAGKGVQDFVKIVLSKFFICRLPLCKNRSNTPSKSRKTSIFPRNFLILSNPANWCHLKWGKLKEFWVIKKNLGHFFKQNSLVIF